MNEEPELRLRDGQVYIISPNIDLGLTALYAGTSGLIARVGLFQGNPADFRKWSDFPYTSGSRQLFERVIELPKRSEPNDYLSMKELFESGQGLDGQFTGRAGGFSRLLVYGVRLFLAGEKEVQELRFQTLVALPGQTSKNVLYWGSLRSD